MSAKRNFEAGQNGPPSSSSASFDAMLFDCARAVRIARDAKAAVAALGVDVEQFLASTNDVKVTRNVIEHWTDILKPRVPKLHSRVSNDGLKIAVDETSLIYMGPTEIYKGKLNLWEVYQFVTMVLERMVPHGATPRSL